MRRTNLRYSRERVLGDSPWKAMKTNCATSSRRVMVFIQRRTAGDALVKFAAGGLGGGRRVAAGAASTTIRSPAKKREEVTATIYSVPDSAAGRALAHGPAGLRCGRLARGSAVHQAFHRADKMSGLVGTLNNDNVGAGILFRESQGFHKAGKQDDADVGIQLADLLDQLDAVHAGHAVIRHDHIELRELKS